MTCFDHVIKYSISLIRSKLNLAIPCNANASAYNANASAYNANVSAYNANVSAYNANASAYNANAFPCIKNATLLRKTVLSLAPCF
ncbi:hypothetical protein [Nostoc mirabile]|uniref:hypothetical protein n=1 Tax=Nostoc mirabile TaxID=2907820 RepID=UPI001E3AC242|nr:hypothetical protein [Nostoc mirabile]